MRLIGATLIALLFLAPAGRAETLNWNYPGANVNLLAGSSNTTVNGITITTSASATAPATDPFDSNSAQILPAGSSNGSSTGIIELRMDADTDDLSSFQTLTVNFGEPVYNLSFTVLDIDGGPTYAGQWNDIVDFSSDNGVPSAVVTNTAWLSYNSTTGRATAIANQNAVSGNANQSNGNIRVTYAGPVTSITVRHYAADASGVTDPAGQVIFVDDLTFQRAPRLAVRKTSTGGVGTFNFDITNGPTGTISTSVTTVTAGTAVTGTQFRLGATNTATTVTETGPAGWIVSTANATCTDANSANSGNPASFTTPVSGYVFTVPATNIRPGAELTCSITNAKRPTVQLAKITQGGTGSFSFSGGNGFGTDTIATTLVNTAANGVVKTLTAAATATTITETVPTGWQAISGTCTGTAAGNVTFATPTATTATITLNATATAAANALVCTFTNRLIPTVALQKITPGAVSTPLTFSFTDTGLTGAFPSIATTAAGVAEPASPTPLPGTVGTAVTITESTIVAGYVIGGVSCTDANATVTGNSTPITSATVSVTIPAGNMVAGAQYTCVFTNNRRPTVTITKISNGGTGAFTFTGDNGWSSQTITTVTAGVGVAGATQTLTAVSTATTITETIPGGWYLTGVTCTGLGSGGTYTPNLTTGRVDFDAAATAPGATIACTFTNGVPAFTVSKTATPASVTAVGETISYTITVTNTGTVPLTGASITSDTLTQGVTNLTLTSGPTGPSGDGGTANVVDPAEAWTYAATYVVTQANIDTGANITNTVVFDTTQTSPQSAFVNTPMPAANPLLAISKSFALVKGSGNTLAGVAEAGDTINYTYTVTNTGNITFSNVEVADSHNGTNTWTDPPHTVLTDNGTAGDSPDTNGNATVWGTLAPLDVVTFFTSYTVNQQDIDTLQ